MSEIQCFIERLSHQALSDWNDGTETPLFPKDENTNKNRANMIWHMMLNAMAYGFEHGMAQGYQMAEADYTK